LKKINLCGVIDNSPAPIKGSNYVARVSFYDFSGKLRITLGIPQPKNNKPHKRKVTAYYL